MRSRAALLPSMGDPYVLYHWLEYFHKYWSDEVDTLYVSVNSNIEKSIIYDIMKRTEHPKIRFSYVDHQTGHGKSINLMLDQCDEEYVVLMEEDAIIFRHGVVDRYFKYIEQNEYDVVGSPRMSCSPKIAELAKKRFGLNYEGLGDKGPGLWPCLLWTKKETLLRTDRHFQNAGWKAGETLLGEVLEEDVAGDTFSSTALQLREMGMRIKEIPQYHCYPFDLDNPMKGGDWNIYSPNCEYMHMGSLSSGIESYLLDENNIALKDRGHSIKPSSIRPLQSDTEKCEMERRVMWWALSWEKTAQPGPFSDLYEAALKKLVNGLNISQERMNKWKELYLGVINAQHN